MNVIKMCPLGASGPHVVCAHNVFTMCPLGIWALVPSEIPNRQRLHLPRWTKAFLKSRSCLLPLKLLFRFRRHSLLILQVRRTRLVLCDDRRGIEVFTLTTTQSSNLSHDKWLASLFSSGLPSPELPDNFLRAIRRVLTSPYPTPSSSMLELSAWSIDLGQASLELMFLSSLCWVRRLRLTHECASQVVVQMAIRDSIQSKLPSFTWQTCFNGAVCCPARTVLDTLLTLHPV